MNDKIKCFIIMPSGYKNEYNDGPIEADYVFEQIMAPAVKEVLNVEIDDIVREVDNNKSGSIGKSIVNNIANSEFAIVDITGLNSNVMYELGIRYVLHRNKTILLLQEDTIPPFDIKDYRYIKYHRLKPVEAKETLKRYLISAKDDKDTKKYSDSPVYDFLENLNVSWESNTEFKNIMPWNLFIDKIDFYIDLLREINLESKNYPDLVLGISNGGMIVADRISMELSSIPVFSVWNNRNAVDNYYFNNNNSQKQVELLKNLIQKINPTILIVDDEIEKGSTFMQLKKLLLKEIPEANILFIPLFTKHSKKSNINKVKSSLFIELPEIKNILKTENEVFELHNHLFTEYSYLPYRKRFKESDK